MSSRKQAALTEDAVLGPWSIPDGWKWVRLDSVGRWYGGGTPSKARPEFWANGTVPWVSPKDMKRPVIDSSQDTISEMAVTNSAVKLVPSGSILCVVRSGILAHTFPVAVSAIPVTVNQDMRALCPRSDVAPDFMAYYLRAAQGGILSQCSKHGTTVASIETSRLDAYPVPLPPIEIQQQVTKRINELLSDVDDGETALAQARADLEVYRRSLLKAAVTGELTVDWRAANPPKETGADLLARILADRRTRWHAEPKNANKRYREPITPPAINLLSIPNGWAWATLPQLGDFGRGKSKHRPRNDPKLYGGDYPFVQTGIVTASHGKINKFSQTYSDLGLAQSKLWPAGTLCITIAANIAFAGVLGFDSCFPDSVVGLTCYKGVRAEYIYLVMSNLQVILERNAPATAQKNINLDVLEQISIPLPPSDEQDKIISLFQESMSVAALLTAHEFDEDIGQLRQSILAAAFRGELL